jgi:hypothetical protein
VNDLTILALQNVNAEVAHHRLIIADGPPVQKLPVGLRFAERNAAVYLIRFFPDRVAQDQQDDRHA